MSVSSNISNPIDYEDWTRFQVRTMDLFPNEQNFDPEKSRQKCYHSLKGHHKISNIPKFRCEML
jgi:hypothetical protein